MNNNNSSSRRSPSCGNVSRGRKRKVLGVGDDDDDEQHHHHQQEMVTRSNSGAHQMRLGSCINHESRIVRVSRSSGGKDRHSKVLTAKGLRDRRVRLSVSTAIQFYDLQDRLRLDQPSKAVEWLLKAASHAIDELPVLDHPFHGTFSNAPPQLTQDTNTITITKVGDAAGGINVFAESSSARGMSSNNDSPSSKEGHQGQCELIQCQQKQHQTKTAFGKGKMTSSKSSIEEEDDDEEGEEEDQDRPTKDTYYSALSLSRSESSCLKAREPSKKTAKESFQFQIPATAGADPAVQNQDGDNDGARDSFTGLLHSVAHVALDSRDTDHNNNREFAQRRRTTSLSMNILHNNPSNSHTHALSPASNPPSLDHLFHDQPQAPHILHSASLTPQQSYGSQSFAFPTFVNAAIFSPLSLQRNEVSKPSGIFCTSEQQKHHLGGSTAHFTTIPNIQQQHTSFVDQEEQNVVPITSHDHMNMMTFSMPGLSGRETLQSNSYNTMAYHMTQRIQPVEASMFTTARNVHMQGGFDNRVLRRSMQDLESESSGGPAFKVTTKLEDHYK